MALQISGTSVVDNNRKGIFTSVNIGVFTPGTRPSASTGDIIYNSTVGAIEVYNGTNWISLNQEGSAKASGGSLTITPTNFVHTFTSSGTFAIKQTIPSVSYIVPRKRGTIVLFDSRTQHRVLKVTKGTRKSIVGWVCGKRWV